MRIVTVVGTRPQLIKLAALQPALRARHDEVFVDTGQHWDAAMAGGFFAELGLAGFIAVIWLAVALVKLILSSYGRAAAGRRELILAVGAALFALALQGMLDYTLRSAVIVALIFTLSGCAVVLSRKDGEDQPRPAAR